MSQNKFSNSDTIIYEELEKGIGCVTLNRPEKLNALNFEIMEAFKETIEGIGEDEDIRVVILTGSGRGFCSGADLMEAAGSLDRKYLDSADLFLRKVQKRFSDITINLRKIPQPVIAAVNGPAAGAGFAMTMASDIRLASPEAVFIASFINIGLSGGEMGSSFLLPRLVGLSKAAEILYTGRKVHAEEAERIGLVSKITSQETLIEEALAIARVMLQKTEGGLILTKRALDLNNCAPSLEAALALEDRNQTVMAVSNEFLKQAMSFVNKK